MSVATPVDVPLIITLAPGKPPIASETTPEMVRCAINPKHAQSIVKDNKKKVGWIKNKDIDWDGISELPKEVQRRICGRVCKYDFGIFDFENGAAKIMWQISPNGKYHYLDKYYGGKTTDEKDIRLYGVIDSNCRVVEKLRITIKDS